MSNPQYHRIMAVGLLAVLVLGFLLAIFVPLLTSGLAYHDEKTDLLFRLHRKQAIAARKDSVAANVETIKQQFQQQGYFSNRTTEALVSADLQEVVKTAVTDAGGQLTSTQGLPGKLDNGFNRVAVRVRMTASVETLRSILRTFSSAVPILVVDQLDITPVRGTRNRANNKIEPSIQLNVSFQVVSFMRGSTQ